MAAKGDLRRKRPLHAVILGLDPRIHGQGRRAAAFGVDPRVEPDDDGIGGRKEENDRSKGNGGKRGFEVDEAPARRHPRA